MTKKTESNVYDFLWAIISNFLLFIALCMTAGYFFGE
jgi:hypothetical protein